MFEDDWDNFNLYEDESRRDPEPITSEDGRIILE
jgi:hypothetical protein